MPVGGMSVEVHEVLPAGPAAQVAALEAQAWPGSAPGHDPALAPRAVLLLDADGRLAASLALLHKPVRLADGRTYRAAGLSAVVTRADLRGRGYGSRLVAAARAELAADPAVDLALFSCDRELVPFFAQGAGPADGEGVDDEGRADEVRAAFTGIRVPLYPGTVDRLW
ncbi:GNAT family N-acetyltransferase [Streptomyces sp. H34-S4]|uniref:GNAT family N-acetyltransferase n=1 Tax=Streptomyces sp. H34-S4 TaxID=2996463 RepID=UPI00226E5826|nr:GNAT family N-acetyltransferase [Streptomyces sp. H34-S4]MCY0937336.1 GNAT family N-acetyltransferase [Streptomyces sp. H34-S4]